MELKPGYRQTEAGVIPNEWKVYTIGQTLRLINGCAFNPRDWQKKGVPIIRIQNLNDSTASFNYSEAIVDEKYHVAAGDVLFAWSGTKGTSFGARVWDGPNGFLNQHIFKVIANEELLSSYYSFLILRKVQEDIEKKAHGFKSSFVHVKKSDIVDVFLPIPSLPEQRAIAAALSDTDALLTSLEQLLAKKRDIKQSVMQQLLTGKQRLPGFNGEWEMKRLGDVVEIRKGQLITATTTSSGNVPVIAGGKTPAYFHSQSNRSGKTITVSGSGANAGYVAFYDRPIFASDCSTISEGKDYAIEFIFFQLQAMQEAIYKAQTGGAQPHIHPTDLRPMMIGCPSLPEQAAIAAVLADMDAEIDALHQRQRKTRAIKQGMMKELLTGRTRLV